MKVALYPGHHSLPFWHRPQQPEVLFDESMADKNVVFEVVERIDEDRGRYVTNEVPAKDFWIWPILKGLSDVDLPLLAHVSFPFDKGTETFSLPKRVWIQISTLPDEVDQDGIPVVVVDGEVQVAHLWGGDNRTHTPYQLLGKEPVDNEQTPEFWTQYILARLVEAKHATIREADEACKIAASAAEKYAVVP
ncbi:hypothetical protein H6786_03480 [Candidatus Nomurabacteria bacterium]|nr:hypothetical protein [Candidatus Nomurabacteria bacterium]